MTRKEFRRALRAALDAVQSGLACEEGEGDFAWTSHNDLERAHTLIRQMLEPNTVVVVLTKGEANGLAWAAGNTFVDPEGIFQTKGAERCARAGAQKLDDARCFGVVRRRYETR